MKLLDKLKNALFEEEYVEVEEKPKKEKKEKHSKIDLIKEKGKERALEEEEKPIAKKIVLPKKEEVEKEIEAIDERETLKGNKDFRFPVVLEEDSFITPKSKIIKEEPKKEKKEQVLYKGAKIESNYKNNTHETKIYEKKKEQSNFKPSPIISPIYGVLDKNYTKDEVINKKEVRLSTATNEHLTVDEVRNRAYGSKVEDILMDIKEEVKQPQQEEIEESQDDMLDLTSDNVTPSVPKVTVGDAEEYFKDLGLEYNKDYIDVSKEKATGRRVPEVKEKDSNEKDDNLFDLIDSMYDKEEK